ncbi:MAG: zinc-dependent metalloprotease [Micrococcaceae bacterium]
MSDDSKKNNDGENENNDPLSQLFSQLFGSGGGLFGPNNGDHPSENGQGFPTGFNLPGLGAINPEDIKKMGSNLPMDPQALQQMIQQFSGMFTMIPGMGSMGGSSSGAGGMNWSLTKDAALKATGDSADVTSEETKDVDEALKLADYWLNDATTFSSTNQLGSAWTRKEWVENSMDVWQKMSQPIAENMSRGLTGSLTEQLPEELRGMLGNASSMLDGLGGSLFGAQFGQAMGQLAQHVLSATDMGIPTTTKQLALVPQNIKEFSEGLDVPLQDIMLFVAVREAAHTRLFHHAPWLRTNLIAAIENYAKGITLDTSNLENLAADLDLNNFNPADMTKINEAMSTGSFIAEKTPEQEKALENIETMLALIEGWVEVVTKDATKQLSTATQIQESIRRRRATGGPAEKAMSSLVGLELRPRRMRDASKLWETIEKSRGIEGRDALWTHPDLLPNAEDLDHPESFEQRDEYRKSGTADIDDALNKLFAGEFDDIKTTDDNSESTSPLSSHHDEPKTLKHEDDDEDE